MNCTAIDALNKIKEDTKGLTEEQLSDVKSMLEEIEDAKDVKGSERSVISKHDLAWATSVLADGTDKEALETLMVNPLQAAEHIRGIIEEYEADLKEAIQDGDREAVTDDKTAISNLEKVLPMLGSEKDANISELEEFNNEFKDIQNNPKKMVKLFDAIGNLDRVAPSDKHKEQLKEVLTTFVDATEQYIQETTIKIAKKFEGKNQGAFSLGKNEIYLGINLNEPTSANEMSAQEVFVHEVVHAAVEHAKTDNKADVVHALHMIDQMYDQASKIQPNDKLSQETLDYIFNRDTGKKHHGTSEFIAYGLTNEAFMKELSNLSVIDKDKKAETFQEQLAIWAKRIVNLVFGLERGARGLTIDEGVMKFSIELARANNTAGKEVQRGILLKATDAINDVDKKVAKFLSDVIQPVKDKSYYELYGKYGRFGGTVLSGVKFWTDKEMKDRLATVLDQTGLGILDKRNTLQTMLRDLRDTDSYNMVIQKMGYNSGNVENAKRTRELSVVQLAKEGFKEALSREEDTALGHAVVETDMATLREYSTEDIKKFLKDNAEINKEAQRLLESLEVSEETKNEYQVRLKDLGYYMATGQSHTLDTMLSTKTIANLVEGGNIENQPTMDKIVSLMAIKHTAEASREVSAEMLSRDEKGVRNLMELQQVVKDNAQKNLFSKESDYLASQSIQGYTRDILNGDMDTKVAPANQVEEMLKEGYIRAEVLPKSKFDTSGVVMAVYVSNEAAKQSWHRQMLHMTDKGRRGTTFTEVHLAANGTSGFLSADDNIKEYKKAAAQAVKEMRAGRYNEATVPMPIPVRSMDGKILDVRYTMSKASKVKYLQRDSRATAMLGRTDSAGLEKMLSEKFNLDAIDVIIDDMRKNMNDSNKDEYIEIKKDSKDEEVKEMFMILPEYLKRHIEDKLMSVDMKKETLWVRKDVYRQIFGYRGFTLDSTAKRNEAYRMVRFAIRLAERIWKSIVSLFKVVIVIKTPAVLIGNILSNIMYSVMTGQSINDVYRRQMDAIEALNQYQKDKHELDQALVSQGIKNTSQLTGRIRDLQKKMKDSPIADMMEQGLYTAIIEDVEVGELEEPNRLARRIDEFMESTPQFVRTGADYLYITKRSPMFKWATKVTQYSDFVARYSLMEHYKRLGIQAGLSIEQAKEIAMSEAIEAFINYDMADSKVLQYANEMGLAMFTKYMMRIQRVIRKGIVKHPIQFLGAIMGQAALFDVSDITESLLFINKNPLDNVQSPMDILGGVLSPPSIEILQKYIK